MFNRLEMVRALKAKRKELLDEILKETRESIESMIVERQEAIVNLRADLAAIVKYKSGPFPKTRATYLRDRELFKYDNAIAILELAVNDTVPQSIVDVRGLL
jgi:hypothetical protein